MLELTRLSTLIADFDRGQYEMGELMMIAVGPLAIACIVFWIGLKMQFAGKPAWIKWLAVIPLVAGVLMGIGPAKEFFTDQLYQGAYGGGGKKAIMHSAGLWMPVIGIIGLALWNKWVARQKFEEL